METELILIKRVFDRSFNLNLLSQDSHITCAMTTYDSDSSGAEENDYTETNVLLGYASKEPSDDIISQLGGRPVYFLFLISDSSLSVPSESRAIP